MDGDDTNGAAGRGGVVVGIDGAPGCRPVLEHALHDAARRHARLRVVAVVPLPDYWMATYGATVWSPSAEVVAEVRAEAQRTVDEVVAAHAGLFARVPVTVVAVVGMPADVLVEASRDADLLVLGHRGRNAFTSAVLGSVGLHCVLYAACSVTIVRPAPETHFAEMAVVGAMVGPVPA